MVVTISTSSAFQYLFFLPVQSLLPSNLIECTKFYYYVGGGDGTITTFQGLDLQMLMLYCTLIMGGLWSGS